MSTEQERERNRQKQKRWYEKHRDAKLLRDRLRRHNEKVLTCWIDFRRLRVAYRTFELADPRDTDLAPRLVGYCRAKQRPVWKLLWALKGFSNAKW